MKIRLLFLSIIASIFSLTGCNKKENDDGYLSVSDAIEVAKEVGDSGTTDRRLVKGTISNITNSNYGEMYISDGTNDIHIYGLYSEDGSQTYAQMEDKPYKGDFIYVSAYISLYNNAPDLGKAWLIKYESNQKGIDVKDYIEMNVSQAREANDGDKIIIEGVVGYITYANGMNPNGIYVVDDNASIYVYGIELAGRVKVGNKIKIAGTKTYYILDTEKNNAAKFGYKGSCQIQDAILLSNDNGNNNIPTSWVKETTIKDVLDTPVSENITTSIFKVHGYIHKVPGVGFVNYYIDDLDDKTGSYCYSLNNGSDFSYLDKYDGQICLIYLSPLNCKSTSSDAYFRLLPIIVEEENYVFDESYAPEFALKYYANEQFLASYRSDPSLKLMTSYTNETFDIDEVEISYASSDENALKFINENNELVMRTYKVQQNVTITMRATYKSYQYSLERSIFVNYVEVPKDALNVKQAIESNDNSEIIVHGIVASSLVNQTGFYLIDDSGTIAVRTSSDTLKEIDLGNEIYIKGIRKHVKKDGSDNVGQSVIDDAEIVVNLYGENEYSKESFVYDKTFEEILDYKDDYATTDHSTTVFSAKAHLIKSETSHSTNYYIGATAEYNKDTVFYLYAGSGSQYNAFSNFVGKGEVEMEFILCDWNSKSEYRACLISVSDGINTVVNNLNFR